MPKLKNVRLFIKEMTTTDGGNVSMYLSKNVSSKSLVATLMVLLFNSACSVSPSKVTTALPSADSSSADAETTVARVNGKEISRAELNQAKKIILANKPGLQIPPLLHKESVGMAISRPEIIAHVNKTLIDEFEVPEDNIAPDKLATSETWLPDAAHNSRRSSNPLSSALPPTRHVL